MSEEKNKEVEAQDKAKDGQSEPQPEPKPAFMEVHKHPHHVTHKKKWAEYFLEFLMIFLAVFLGFVAENFRERQVEKEKGRQYVRSLYEDLKLDTARINEMILYDDDKIEGMSNIESCFDTVSLRPEETQCMGKLILYSRTNRSFSITDRTITQLGNAGGFRILDKADADSIWGYINIFKLYQDFQSTVFQTSQDNLRNTLNEIAKFKAIETLLRNPAPPYGTTSSAITPDMVLHGSLLISQDKTLLNKWFTQLLIYRRGTIAQRNQMAGLLSKASALIQYYKNKYHFD